MDTHIRVSNYVRATTAVSINAYTDDATPSDNPASMMKLTVLALLASAAFSFSPISQSTRPAIQLRESFGFGFAEDTYENQPALLKGEQEYKQFVNKYAENNMLNRKVRLFI